MLKKLVLSVALCATPAVAENVTIETYRGPAEVPFAPETIAVYDIAALDTLTALGVPVAGTVSKVYVDYLQDVAAGLTPVGSLFEPDFEAVAALGADLIVAGGRSADLTPKLSKIAPTVDMTIWEDTVGQGLERLHTYGQIFGKESEAKALADAFLTKLDSAKAALKGKGGALIVMTNGPKISAYGAGGRFGWLHTDLELPEAVEQVEQTTHGEAISFEFIREADPEILIVVDRLAAIGQDGTSARTTLDNALVHETKAWKNGNVVFLNSAPLYIAGGGIQSMNIILDQIIDTVSGD
jgi:iron complex transport system substrate-binding protein